MAPSAQTTTPIAQTPDSPVTTAAITNGVAPTGAKSRINSLDALRGLAVLMIFVVNIKMMANGYNHYADRSLWEGAFDPAIGYVHSVFVHGKFVTIFTALFGAGLALLLAREQPVAMPIVLRRLFWLAVFGAIHLIFIREGDIVLQYALVGVIAIAFVRQRATVLFALGFAIQAALLFAAIVFPVEYTDIPILWETGPDTHLEVERIMLGSFADHVSARIDTVKFYLFDLFIVGWGWLDKLSVMIFGMALLKTGFLTGELAPKAYLKIGVAGALSASLLIAFRLSGGAELPYGENALNALWILHRFGGAMAWSALVVGAVAMGWRAAALAAAGRAAFSIYILQSVIGLALFSSLGLGLFGQLTLGALSLVTLAVTAFFLIAAPLWFARYRFGPLEWAWRSLTYGERQPWLRAAKAG